MPQETEQDLTYILSDLNARVRTLENKYNLLAERLLVVNQNMIEEYKKVLREIKVLNEELREMKKDLFQMKDTFSNVIKEMQSFAKSDQIKVLEKYINLWSPLNFVTEDQLNKILDEKLKLVKPNKNKIKSE